MALEHPAPSNSEANVHSNEFVLLTSFLSNILPQLTKNFQTATVDVTVMLLLVSGTMAIISQHISKPGHEVTKTTTAISDSGLYRDVQLTDTRVLRTPFENDSANYVQIQTSNLEDQFNEDFLKILSHKDTLLNPTPLGRSLSCIVSQGVKALSRIIEHYGHECKGEFRTFPPTY